MVAGGLNRFQALEPFTHIEEVPDLGTNDPPPPTTTEEGGVYMLRHGTPPALFANTS
jgi:hypothetical protein